MKFLLQLFIVAVVAVLALYGYAYLAQDQQLMATLDYKVNGVLQHFGTNTEEVVQYVNSQRQ